ncbi:MAG: hypothetical protein ACOYD0_11860 [Candidatus Nanopelagicales bacterium]
MARLATEEELEQLEEAVRIDSLMRAGLIANAVCSATYWPVELPTAEWTPEGWVIKN